MLNNRNQNNLISVWETFFKNILKNCKNQEALDEMYIYLLIRENTQLLLVVKLAECKTVYVLFVLVSTTFIIATKQRTAVTLAFCSIYWASRAAG